MIEVIPSIQIIGGKCIRLSQGDYSTEKVYDENPLRVAQTFEDHGIKQISIIDLDGSKTGSVVNYPVLDLIARHTTMKVDFSGGISTQGDVRRAFESGATTVTVGTVAVINKEVFTNWIFSYGREKIVLSADAENEKIATRGWQNKSEIDIFDHLGYYYERGIKYAKCTDIARDGVLQGPNFDFYKKIVSKFPDLKVLASGGISSVADIEQLDELGVHGVIFGRSYYEGKINLKDLEKFIVRNEKVPR